jgi:hypothetical protein
MTMSEREKSIGEILAEAAADSEAGRDLPADYVRARGAPKEASKVYSLRVPEKLLAQLRELAEAEGVEPSALMRRWVIERIEEEQECRDGRAAPVPDIRGKLRQARELLDEVRRAEERIHREERRAAAV